MTATEDFLDALASGMLTPSVRCHICNNLKPYDPSGVPCDDCLSDIYEDELREARQAVWQEETWVAYEDRYSGLVGHNSDRE
jgi:hypothetical protein